MSRDSNEIKQDSKEIWTGDAAEGDDWRVLCLHKISGTALLSSVVCVCVCVCV